MWGHPVTPLVFLTITVWFLGNMLVTRPGPSFAGLGLILTGLPAYFLWNRYAQPTSIAPPAASTHQRIHPKKNLIR